MGKPAAAVHCKLQAREDERVLEGDGVESRSVVSVEEKSSGSWKVIATARRDVALTSGIDTACEKEMSNGTCVKTSKAVGRTA